MRPPGSAHRRHRALRASKARLRNEAALQSKVLAFVHGIAFVENRSPSPFGAVGVPDLIGVYRGRYFAIELKHPRKGPPGSDDERWASQKLFLTRVWQHDGFAMGTNNYEAVVDFFSSIDECLELRCPCGFYCEDWKGE